MIPVSDTPTPRIEAPEALADDELDRSLRPRRLEDFVGQDTLREQLSELSAEGGVP